MTHRRVESVERAAVSSFTPTLVYLVLVLYRPQEYLDSLENVPILPVALIIAFTLWFFTERKVLVAPQYALMPALVLVMTVSMVVSGWVGGAVYVIEQMLPAWVFFLLLAHHSRDPARLVQLFRAIAIVVVVIAIHGILQNENGVGWTGAKTIQGRITYLGIFNDPNDLGILFVITLPLLAFLLRISRQIFSKLLYLLFIGVVIYGVYLTDSRGSMLAVLAMGGFAVYRIYGKGSLVICTLLLLPALALLSSETRFGDISPGEGSAFGRIDAWYKGLHLFLQNPFLGVGFERFTDHHELTAHNSFVLVLAELGLVGYFLWFSLIGLSAWMMYLITGGAKKTEPTRKFDADQLIALAILTAFVGFIAAGFFLSRSYNMLLFLLCGLAVGHYQGFAERVANVPAISFSAVWKTWAMLSVLSIASLFVLVKILFAFA